MNLNGNLNFNNLITSLKLPSNTIGKSHNDIKNIIKREIINVNKNNINESSDSSDSSDSSNGSKNINNDDTMSVLIDYENTFVKNNNLENSKFDKIISEDIFNDNSEIINTNNNDSNNNDNNSSNVIIKKTKNKKNKKDKINKMDNIVKNNDNITNNNNITNDNNKNNNNNNINDNNNNNNKNNEIIIKPNEKITLNDLNDLLYKKILSQENSQDDIVDWIDNKITFKSNDEFKPICLYFDKHIFMNSTYYYNINTNNYLINLDTLILNFENIDKTKINNNYKYYIYYKELFNFNKKIDAWTELSLILGNFKKNIVDGNNNKNIQNCKKYLENHSKFKKNNIRGVKYKFECNNNLIDIYCLICK
jgi:hypothetical protein